MISKYNSFLSELLLERAINESILYYSPDLRKIIKKIDSDISLDLIKSETTDIKADITFVDLDQEGLNCRMG
jgi:DICT domain-containing protein